MVIFAAVLIAAAVFAQSFRKKHYHLMSMRKYFFAFSATVMAIGLASLIFNGLHIGGAKLNFSLEYTGGTILELGFENQNLGADEIGKGIGNYNKTIQDEKQQLKPPLIQMVGTPKTLEFPDQLREVTITVKNKDGSQVNGDGLRNVITPITDFFGKSVLLDKAIQSGPETSFKIGLSKLDLTTPQTVPKTPESEGKKTVTDEQQMSLALSEYDKNLEMVSMTPGEIVAVPGQSKSVQYKDAIIRVLKEDGSNLSADDVLNLMISLAKALNTNVYKFKVESIGPIIGSELKQKAILAIIVALCIQLIYITLRFGNQVRFGLAADIALFHDLIIMTGIYSVVGREIDSPFLAAILTVIGYSVMDSIVIFDRIRENLKTLKKETYEEAVNISVNQTMTRSINTLLTVLLCLCALYFFGGETLKNFAFALLVGCTTGAYSSICIASPILVLIDNWVKKREAERVATRRAALAAAAQSRADRIAQDKARRDVVPQEKEEVEEQLPEDTGGPRVTKKTKSKQRRRYNKAAKKKQ